MKRRRFIRSTLAAGLAACPLGSALAAGAELPRTPRDYEGPYYPRGERHRTGDLVTGSPRGKVLYFRGQVVDVHGEPRPGVLVEIWQTDMNGRYDHPADKSPGKRWADFLYWGESRTDLDGGFQFRTYAPGAYGRRPAHIHYKLWSNRELLLTSQVYFHERGGAGRASRHPRLADLQTTSLVDIDADYQEAVLRVVV